MTQGKTVVPLLEDDDNSNPYNARKDYITPDDVARPTADEPFYPGAVQKKTKQKTDDDSTTDTTKGQDHDYELRFKNLKKRYDTEIHNSRKELEQLKEQMSKLQSPPPPPENKEELDKWKQDNPDLYKIFENLITDQTSQVSKEVDTRLSEVEKRERQIAKREALREIREKHSDFDSIVESDEFHDWAESQPEEIQNWVYNSLDSARTIKAIDLYKLENGLAGGPTKESANESNELEGADGFVSVRGQTQPTDTQKKIWSRAEIAKMSIHEYEKHESEIDLAIREGRVR